MIIMKRTILFVFLLCAAFTLVKAQEADSSKVYKKKVLESTEVDLLYSLYNQAGVHSPVNGGIGTEQLVD